MGFDPRYDAEKVAVFSPGRYSMLIIEKGSTYVYRGQLFPEWQRGMIRDKLRDVPTEIHYYADQSRRFGVWREEWRFDGITFAGPKAAVEAYETSLRYRRP